MRYVNVGLNGLVSHADSAFDRLTNDTLFVLHIDKPRSM